MATTIKIKSSATAGVSPSTLSQGELAANVVNARLWVGNASDTPVEIHDRATVSGTAPSSPLAGELWFNSTDGRLYVYNGSSWLTNNARAVPRFQAVTTATSVTPDIGTYDLYIFSALASALAINATTQGTPIHGDKLLFRFKDNGTSRALNWTTSGANSFRAIGVTLPTATTTSKTTYVGCIYNATDAFWDVIAVGTQA